MRIFCEIHETNYDSKEGCPLWWPSDWEYKAKHNCLPKDTHPLYNTCISKEMPEEEDGKPDSWKLFSF